MKWLDNFTYPALLLTDILRHFRSQAEIIRNWLKFSATGRQGYGMLRNMAVCYGWPWGLAD
jgi:hypothetical protein